jgi:hypothetical protein
MGQLCMQLLLMVMFRPSIASDEGWIPTLAATKEQHPNSLLLEQQMPGFGADIIRYLSGDTIDPAPLRARNSEPQRTKITLDTSSDAADEEVSKRILEIFQTLFRASLLLSVKEGKCQDIVDLLMPPDPVDLNSYVSMMSNTDTPSMQRPLTGIGKWPFCCLSGALKSISKASSSVLPFMQRAYFGHVEVVIMLLAWGAETNSISNILRATPLELAATMGHTRCMLLLLKLGADVNRSDGTAGSLSHAAAGLQQRNSY